MAYLDMENLNKYEIKKCPIETFLAWFDKAKELDSYPDAFALATACPKGDVSVRYLLYKGIVNGELSFYTNYNSNKAKQIEANPTASMAFFWRNSGRQVRVTGDVKRMSKDKSMAYFRGRDRDSQIASYISNQSSEILDKEALLDLHSKASVEFEGSEVPYPDNWGGYLVNPSEIEFFIYGEHRLNDRILFKKGVDDSWGIKRLQP
jgi:pyridoxamine 5'-phosphate oxidase